MGIFANETCPKGIRLGEYTGDLLSEKAYDRVSNKFYMFELSKRSPSTGRYSTYYIDASNPRKSGLLRYANGARTASQKKKINAEAYQYAEKIYYRSLREIKAGEEIIIDYGDNYWI